MTTPDPPIATIQVGHHKQYDIDGMSEAEFEASVIHQRVIEAIADVVPETSKEEVADKVISIITEEIETYSGNIPHPRHAEHWERILPGAANRILTMAEQRSTAAIEQIRADERILLAELKRDDDDSRRLANFKTGGLVTGFLLGFAMVLGALYAGSQGQLALALALIGASALGTVGYFVNSGWRIDRARESDD